MHVAQCSEIETRPLKNWWAWPYHSAPRRAIRAPRMRRKFHRIVDGLSRAPKADIRAILVHQWAGEMAGRRFGEAPVDQGILEFCKWSEPKFAHVVSTFYQSSHLSSTQTNANLEQCPYNANHYVPSSSLERHKARCWYSSQGVKVDRETAQTLASTGAFYGGRSNIPHIHIGMPHF